MKNTLIPFVTIFCAAFLASIYLCDVREGWSLPDWQIRALCAGAVCLFWACVTRAELLDLRKFRQEEAGARAAARRALRVRCRVALLANPKRA